VKTCFGRPAEATLASILRKARQRLFEFLNLNRIKVLAARLGLQYSFSFFFISAARPEWTCRFLGKRDLFASPADVQGHLNKHALLL
jgi:hypothetical protein